MCNKKPCNLDRRNSRKSEGGLYKGIFFGLVVGAGLVWLFTTERGKKIRQQLQGENTQWLKIARDFLEENEAKEAKETIANLSQVIKENVEKIVPAVITSDHPVVSAVTSSINTIPQTEVVMPSAIVKAEQKKFFRRKKSLFGN